MAWAQTAQSTTLIGNGTITRVWGTGDILLFVCSCDGTGNADATLSGGVTGSWTKLAKTDLTSDGQTISFWWGVAAASGNVAVTQPLNADPTAVIYSFSGGAGTINVALTANTGDTQQSTPVSAVGSSITPSVDHCLVVCIAALDKGGTVNLTSWTVPSGMTAATTAIDNGWSAYHLAWLDYGAHAATGTKTWSVATTQTAGWLTWMIAFDPAAGGGGSTDQPRVQRRPLEEATEEPPRRRRLWAPPPIVAAQPFRRARMPEEAADEMRVRRLFVPIIAAPSADSPPARFRARAEVPTDEDTRAGRRLVPVAPAAIPDSPPPRASSALARRLVDESLEQPDPRARKLSAAPRGSMAFTADTSTGAVDLTAVGASDWRTWVGTGLPADVVRKASGANQISDWTPFGAGATSWAAGVEPNTVLWSDGNPTATGSHAGVLRVTGAGEGFSWTAPADLTSRTVHLYLHKLAGGSFVRFAAFLSDSSADDLRVDDFTDGEWNLHLTYQAAAPGQTLTLYFIGFGASTEMRVRALALAGALIPGNVPFRRRLLVEDVAEELRAVRRLAPIVSVVIVDSPPPRVRTRIVESTDDDPRARRSTAPIAVAVTPDSPPPRFRARQEEPAEDAAVPRRQRAPGAGPVVADNPPPRSVRRREEEPDVVVGRRDRKVAPPPAVTPDNPPPRAGRSNWRVSWESWEPVEFLRKVWRLVFPGVVSPTLTPPFVAVFDTVDLTIEVDDIALTLSVDNVTLTLDEE